MKAIQRADRSAGQSTILAVDDGTRSLALVAAILSANGCRLIMAAGPLDALRVFEAENQAIDLVISPVRMPEMSGPDLVAHLCDRKPTLRSMFISGLAGQVIGGQPVPETLFSHSELQAKVAQTLTAETRYAKTTSQR